MAASYDITIAQGAELQHNLIWKDSAGVPIDLTGYTAKMQVRQRYASDDAVLSLSTTAGTIVLGGVACDMEPEDERLQSNLKFYVEK